MSVRKNRSMSVCKAQHGIPVVRILPSAYGVLLLDDLRHATVGELPVRLRSPAGRSELFNTEVVDELLRRAELSERLEAQIRDVSLRAISPPKGYSADDF